MPTIDIVASGFGNAALNATHTTHVTRTKCIKFAMTVGNSHFSRAFGKTQTALAMAAYRAMGVRCVIDFSHATLRPFTEFAKLETSEKANLSFWIGMTLTAIAADEVLNVPRTIHALHMGKRIKRANPKSNSLADLVGQDGTNAWHVLEAKGRKGAVSPQDRLAWKAQAGTIASVDTVPVTTQSYCIGLISNPLGVELVDPPSKNPTPINLTTNPNDFGRGYYKPYIEFVEQDPRKIIRGGRVFVVRPIAFDPIEKDFIYIGLEDKYFFLSDPQTPFKFSVEEYEENSFYVGTDGVAIATSPGPCDL